MMEREKGREGEREKVKRIFVSSGELSSEMHAEMVLRAFAEKYPGQFTFFGLGGEVSRAAGLDLIENIVDRAVIGFSEAVKNLGYFRKLLGRIDAMMARGEMDGLLLIDYPGLNLHIARLAAKHNLPVVFFISPQVWAWRKGRAKTLARRIKKMLVLFPFETAIYESAGCPVEFVGHPFVDRVVPAESRGAARKRLGLGETDTLISLMPGSRRQEVSRHFPVMWEAASLLARERPLAVMIAQARTIPSGFYRYWMQSAPPNLKAFLLADERQRHTLVAASDLALVTTGTTTVETMLLGTPMIAGYRLSRLSYLIARLLVNVKYCAMPNILADAPVVPELIQDRFTPRALADEARRLLSDQSRRSAMRALLADTAAKLGPKGAAGRVAAAAAGVFLHA
ncbi:lipid-A-disaccharide synthase [bacterium]|nr:lipid-A-disaccharide synthase [bacterium]